MPATGRSLHIVVISRCVTAHFPVFLSKNAHFLRSQCRVRLSPKFHGFCAWRWPLLCNFKALTQQLIRKRMRKPRHTLRQREGRTTNACGTHFARQRRWNWFEQYQRKEKWKRLRLYLLFSSLFAIEPCACDCDKTRPNSVSHVCVTLISLYRASILITHHVAMDKELIIVNKSSSLTRLDLFWDKGWKPRGKCFSQQICREQF